MSDWETEGVEISPLYQLVWRGPVSGEVTEVYISGNEVRVEGEGDSVSYEQAARAVSQALIAWVRGATS